MLFVLRLVILANFSHRISKSKDLVLLGEHDEYEPLSRAAFNKKFKKMIKNGFHN